MQRNRWLAGKFVVLKIAAGGSTGGNGARGRRVKIMKSSTGNGVRCREIACRPISDFKVLTLANETSIFARTAEINGYYLMTLFCGTQFKRAEMN